MSISTDRVASKCSPRFEPGELTGTTATGAITYVAVNHDGTADITRSRNFNTPDATTTYITLITEYPDGTTEVHVAIKELLLHLPTTMPLERDTQGYSASAYLYRQYQQYGKAASKAIAAFEAERQGYGHRRKLADLERRIKAIRAKL